MMPFFKSKKASKPFDPKKHSTKPPDAAKPGFLSRLASMFSSRPSQEVLEAKGIMKTGMVFGNSLQVLAGKGLCDSAGIPFVFRALIEELQRKEGHTLQGIFRESGNQTEISGVKQQIDFGEVYDLKTLSPHSLSGLIKLFLRELPDPLLGFDRYPAFVEPQRTNNYPKVMQAFERSLPPPTVSISLAVLSCPVGLSVGLPAVVPHPDALRFSCVTTAFPLKI